MTRKQSIILWFGITIILLMTMFPPILKTIPAEGDGSSYRQVIEYEYYFTKSFKKILLQRLFMEWFVVALITGGLLYTYKPGSELK